MVMTLALKNNSDTRFEKSLRGKVIFDNLSSGRKINHKKVLFR